VSVLTYQKDLPIRKNGDNCHRAGVEDDVAAVLLAIAGEHGVTNKGQVGAAPQHLSVNELLDELVVTLIWHGSEYRSACTGTSFS
jgi:hypothetical protein